MRLGRLVFWWCTAQSLILFIFGGVCYITSNDLESVVGGMTVTRNSRPGSVIVLRSNLSANESVHHVKCFRLCNVIV